MCGIWAVFGHTANVHSLCSKTFEKIAHRGPDAWRIEYDSKLKVNLIFSDVSISKNSYLC